MWLAEVCEQQQNRYKGSALIALLTRVLSAPQLPEQDLYKPEAPRLRRNLSAIINFAKYREEKLLAYEELQVRGTGNKRQPQGAGQPALARLLFSPATRRAHMAQTRCLQEHLAGLVEGKEALAAENAALQAELSRLQEERAAEMPVGGCAGSMGPCAAAWTFTNVFRAQTKQLCIDKGWSCLLAAGGGAAGSGDAGPVRREPAAEQAAGGAELGGGPLCPVAGLGSVLSGPHGSSTP